MEITIDRGYRTYDIKDTDGTLVGTIRFNPADPGIAGRLDEASKKIETLRGKPVTPENMMALDKAIRDQLDYAFGSPVSDVLFGGNSAVAFCDNGRLLIENVLDAIFPVVRAEIESAQKASADRMEKYTAPYKDSTAGLAPGQSL